MILSRSFSVHALRASLVVLAVVVAQPVYAQQNLSISLFERSLDQLRQESGIPGLSAVIVQDGQVVWERGFGLADVERSIEARPDTPYLIGDLTQALGATLVLQRVDRGDFDLVDRVNRWTTAIPEQSATIGQVLRHTSTGSYQYNLTRIGLITPIVEYYARRPFRKLLADEVLERLSMLDSAPGHDLEQSPPDVDQFDAGDLARYRGAIQRLAAPYRVDSRRRATRSDYPSRGLSAATGMIASARDLAAFDRALEERNLLLSDASRAAMMRRNGSAPTGLGWFVQSYNGRDIVWQFGNLPNASSSLLLKVPERRLTLVLLANSDGLSAPFALDQGDVTTSLFARLFLRVFLP
jgi:CubicO group peptidase (beta-lactamase class C family)